MSNVKINYENIDGIIYSVKCASCGMLHDAKGKTFVRLMGGVCNGLQEQIIGGGKGDQPLSTYYCKECLIVVLANKLKIGIKILPANNGFFGLKEDDNEL